MKKTSEIKIPFNKPCVVGEELNFISQAMSSGHLSGDGSFTNRCQLFLESNLGIPKALLSTSCTHALEMAALLLDIQPGDEVLMPSYTFVSVANAFVLRGARPIFIDIRHDTLNIDEKKIESAITSKTRAIVLVHYAGVACAMDAIEDIAKRYRLSLIEDNAHGLFAKYKGRYLGTFGDIATLSFHETKNFTCGEGGAILINKKSLIPRAEILREKGTNRSNFFRGQVDKYTWVDIGSSYLPSELSAAYLYAQLKFRDAIQSKRRLLWNKYLRELSVWASEFEVQLPSIPEECEQSYHIFYLIMPKSALRDQLIAHLRERGILSVFHYQPLHDSKMGKAFGYSRGALPVSERVSDCLLRLPLYFSMTESELDEVVQAVLSYKPSQTVE